MNLPKHYDPKIVETKWQQFWEKEHIFAFDTKDTSKETYAIDTPPPTVSGKMHIGHAFSFSQQDFIARYKRMRGYNVFYPWGTDDNGLATEKLVQKSKGVNLRKIPRDEAKKICQDFLEVERPKFTQDWKNIGMSCDFSITYSTITDKSRAISQRTFLELAKKGLVYRKKGPIMWDRVFQTAIAQAELEDKTVSSSMNYIKAAIEGEQNTYVIYATTRPELFFGCVGMSVENEGVYVKIQVENDFWIIGKAAHDKFKSYPVVETLSGHDLIGKSVNIPIAGIKVVIDHDESVKADMGTGIVYFCTYGGLDCVEWMTRRPQLIPIEVMGKDGRLNDLNGDYNGMLANEARAKVIADLEAQGYLVKKEKIEHVVNVGERSGVEVEYIVSEQWYVKYLDQKELFLKASEELEWYPKFMKHRLDNWIKGLNWDWSFSRQRHFGVPIPVWYDKEGNIYYADESQLPVDPTKDVPKGVDKEVIGETDVFDTWFTSGSTPQLAIELVDKNLQSKLFPMDMRPQAHDIINFWLFYTLAKSQLLYGKNPWKQVLISGWALDPHGKKMSKSKGNVVAPQDMIEKYSADALRFWAAGSKLGEDMPFQEKDLVTGKKTITKLWNASKFALIHLEEFSYQKHDLQPVDTWLLMKLSQVISNCTHYFDTFDYAKAKMEVETFFWHIFCDQYLELVKERLYNPQNHPAGARESAQYTLYETLLTILKLFAPIMPYVTEEIYQLFFRAHDNKKSIHISAWPLILLEQQPDIMRMGDMMIAIIDAVRKHKSENQLSMKAEIPRIIIQCSESDRKLLENVLMDIQSVCSIQDVSFGDATIEVLENVYIGI